MAWIRTEEEVDKMIEELIHKSKSKYITQSVTFNKKNPRQLELLKKALMSSESFGGFMRELLAEKFNDNGIQPVSNVQPKLEEKVVKKDVGNYL